jgi:hypothetical protein
MSRLVRIAPNIVVEERHLPPSALSKMQRLIPTPIRFFWSWLLRRRTR